MKPVFITGGTGYIGRRLITMLLRKGMEVHALVRKGSEGKLPPGCKVVIADPFNADSFSNCIPKRAVFVQMLGVPHPGPSKKDQFRTIDLRSAQASLQAAVQAGCSRFVYVSVAQTPSGIMADYQQVRAEAERLIRASGIEAVILRPWYVVGPGHYWPLLFLPLYPLLEWLPATRKKARAFRLVKLRSMLWALVNAVETPQLLPVRIMEVEQIRKFR